MIFKVFDKSCVPPFGRGPGSVLPRHVVEAARRQQLKLYCAAVENVENVDTVHIWQVPSLANGAHVPVWASLGNLVVRNSNRGEFSLVSPRDFFKFSLQVSP